MPGLHQILFIWVFPKIVVPQDGWFIMENPIKMDELGVPLFSETAISMSITCSTQNLHNPSAHILAGKIR